MITPHLTREASREHYAPGTEFEIDLITMAGNTGTYLDSPFHRYADGGDLASLALETLVDVPAEVFRLDRMPRSARHPRRGVLRPRPGGHRGAAAHRVEPALRRGPSTRTGSPFLTEAGAQHLVDAGVAIVGIDSLNIDDTESGGERPAHSILLAAGIHVVEHLTALERVPVRGRALHGGAAARRRVRHVPGARVRASCPRLGPSERRRRRGPRSRGSEEARSRVDSVSARCSPRRRGWSCR